MMNQDNRKIIDCFFIGHNEMDFVDYEKSLRETGLHSGAYRDLNLNFVWYDAKPFHASQLFNLFSSVDKQEEVIKPLNIMEPFSAAIAYLGSCLHKRGWSFDYINSFQEEKEILVKKLTGENIRTIAIITTLYVSVLPILEIVDFIRKYNSTAKIIIGGPFVATQVRVQEPEVLAYTFRTIDADFFVNSAQGETALVEILSALTRNQPLDRINNIYYKNGSGYTAGPMVNENNRLDENPVNWDLFARRLGRSVNVRTAISCPFSCAFCGFPQHAGKYQVMTVARVEAELDLLSKNEKVESLQFIDDTFNVPAKRFKEILRMMIDNKYKFKWHSHFRCGFADREMVELMKESGCEGVFLGIESGSDAILKNMNKAVTTEQYLKGIALLEEYGILTYGSFIIGFPGETNETVRESIAFIKESGIDFFRAQLWYCEPITPIWKQREKYGIKGSNFEWTHATMSAPEACDIIDDIFLSIDEPIWIPQYSFEFDAVFHLLHRGMTPDQVRLFIRSFNHGVRKKVKSPPGKINEISLEVINQLRTACQGSEGADETGHRVKVSENDAGFDF